MYVLSNFRKLNFTAKSENFKSEFYRNLSGDARNWYLPEMKQTEPFMFSNLKGESKKCLIKMANSEWSKVQ